MPHLSNNPLPKQTRVEIEKELIALLFQSNTKGAKTLFTELLTETEVLMLAKRLATLLMLIDEQSYYRIEQLLGVSSSTSKRLHRMLVGGAFESLERKIERAKEKEELSRKIGLILRGGLPPRAYTIKKRKAGRPTRPTPRRR